MPVSTSSHNMEAELEAAVLSDRHGVSYFRHIEGALQQAQKDGHSQRQQTCSVEMTRKLITVIQEQLPCCRFWQVEVMVSVVKHIASASQSTQSQAFSDLLDNGLNEILVYVFDGTREHISQGGGQPKPAADHLLEVLLETINDVAEYSETSRELVVGSFAARLLALVVDSRKSFHTRMEAERTFNLLLEGCEDNTVEDVTKDPAMDRLMKRLAEYLHIAGDFEMQMAVTESLARLVKRSEREQYCAEWFPSAVTARAFLDIQDSQFDADCRKFLNLLNRNVPEQSVFSFSCLKAYLGKYELRHPNDDNVKEFWVDFNSASGSITMYVADEDPGTDEEGGLWETVTLRREKIKEYCVTEEASGCINLRLTLSEPVSSLLPFCASESQMSSIVFSPKTDLYDALAASLGLDKNAHPVDTPSSCSRRSSVSKVNVLVNRAKNTSWGLSNMAQSIHDGYVEPDGCPTATDPAEQSRDPQGKPHQRAGSTTPSRQKSSVPKALMCTPGKMSLTASPAVVPSVSSHGFSNPRTPTSHHGTTKKVKTPLQITVADKARPSSSNAHHTDIVRSARKVSVATDAVICQSPLVHSHRAGEARAVSDVQAGKMVLEASGVGRVRSMDAPKTAPLDQVSTPNDTPLADTYGCVNRNGQREGGNNRGASDDGRKQTDVSTVGGSAADKRSAVVDTAKTSCDSDPNLAGKSKGRGRKGAGKAKVTSDDQKEEMAVNGAVQKDKRKIASPEADEAPMKTTKLGSYAAERKNKAAEDQKKDKKNGKGKTKGKDHQTEADDVSSIPDTQSQSVADEEDAGSKKTSKSRRRGKEQKTEASSQEPSGKRITRSSASQQSSVSSQALIPDSKPRRGKKFKLYSDASMVQQDSSGDHQAAENSAGKKSPKASKQGKGKSKMEEMDKQVPALVSASTHTGENGRGKDTEQRTSNSHKPVRKPRHENTGKEKSDDNNSQTKSHGTPDKVGVNNNKMSGRCPLMEDSPPLLSQEFVVPAVTARGQPTFGTSQLRASRLTSQDLMLEGGSQEEDRQMNQSHLPPCDEKSAALALAAENAEFSIQSSAPEERYEDIVPDSQPMMTSLNRRGRFPSPMLSDITEETSISRSTQSRGSTSLRDGLKSPYLGNKSDNSSILPSHKSRPKPQAAVPDSTSHILTGKDPYAFEESSNCSSVRLQPKKANAKDGGWKSADLKKSKEGRVDCLEDPGGRNKHLEASQELIMTDDSQEDFVPSSLKSGKVGQLKQNSKSLEVGGGGDRSTKRCNKDVITEKPKKSKKKMKGKLDSTDNYVHRVAEESRKSAEFAKMIQEEQYPDIEVARDVDCVTDMYEDMDINAFVKSVMKSLPCQKKGKGSSRDPILVEDVDLSQEDREEYKSDEAYVEEIVPDSAAKRRKEIHQDAEKAGIVAGNTKEADTSTKSGSNDEQHCVLSITPVTGERGKRHSTDGGSRKRASSVEAKKDRDMKGIQKQSGGKVQSEVRRMAGREDSSAGELSVDDMIDSHMTSILGSSCVESAKKKKKECELRKKPESRTKEDRLSTDVHSSAKDEAGLYAEGAASRNRKSTAAANLVIASLTDDDNDVDGSAANLGTANDAEDDYDEVLADLSYCKEKGMTGQKRKAKRPYQLSDEEEEEAKSASRDHVSLKASKASRRDKRSKKNDDRKPTSTSSDFRKDVCQEDSPKKQRSRDNKSWNDNQSKRKNHSMATDMQSGEGTKEFADTRKKKGGIKKSKKTHFGSQIEESDTEDVHLESQSVLQPDDTSAAISVDSFASLCKDLLKSSRKGLATGRGKRNLPQVDYTEMNDTWSESNTTSDLQTPARSAKKTTLKALAADIYDYHEEPATSLLEDVVSECSWLAEKPKQKVSTYSKTRTAVLGCGKISKNLDTVRKPARQQSALKNAPAPKKKRLSYEQDVEEEEQHLLYYAGEEEESREKARKKKSSSLLDRTHSGQRSNASKGEDHMSFMKGGCRRSLADSMSTSVGRREVYASCEDLLHDGKDADESLEEEEQENDMEDALLATPALTIDTVTSQISPWVTPASLKGTPKQVSFLEEDQEYSNSEEDEELQNPTSGPCKRGRPNNSTLKRKYSHLLDVADEVEDSEEGEEECNAEHHKKEILGLKEFSLEPKKLFEEIKDNEEHTSASGESGEVGEISEPSVSSSSWDQNLTFPTMQVPEIFGFMRSRLKQKMMLKKRQTQELTDIAIQSTKSQMTKLFKELHRARQQNQSDFQHRLLTELVHIESSVEKLSKVQAQNDQILKQYKKRSTDHLAQHVKKVQDIHKTFLRKSSQLEEDEAGAFQQVICREMKNMLQKMLKDMQKEQMQKTMQSFLLMR